MIRAPELDFRDAPRCSKTELIVGSLASFAVTLVFGLAMLAKVAGPIPIIYGPDRPIVAPTDDAVAARSGAAPGAPRANRLEDPNIIKLVALLAAHDRVILR